MLLNPVVALLRVIYSMVKGCVNGHLYALKDSVPDRETYLKLLSHFYKKM